MAQRSLFDLGFNGGQKRNADICGSDNECSTPTKRAKISGTDSPKSKVKRKFRSEWLNEYEWLEVKEIDGETLLFCKWCRAANKNNPYANSGSPNLQKYALDRHANKNPDHLQLANARLLVKAGKTTKDIIEIQESKQNDENTKSKEAQINTAFFIAQNNIPLSMHNKLVQLQRDNGCEALQNEKSIYTSTESHDQMIDAIDSHIKDIVNKDLQSSEFVGIIIDETTDITVHKKLNIYFKCFRAGTSETVMHFLNCVSVEDGRAETLVQAITSECANIGLDIMKIVSMASDGAKVMTGHKGGVGALLRKNNPRLVQVHCVAHRLALCAAQACQDVPMFQDFTTTLKNVYRYFHNSPVRYNKLGQLEEIMNDTNKDTKHVTLKEPAATRWLSLESAVKAIHEVLYPALVLALESEAVSNSEAKGLLKKVKTATFVLVTSFLRDVLGAVNKLCKIFQKDELNIDIVNTSICATKDTLEALKVKNGAILQTAYDCLQDGKYGEVKVTDHSQMRISFQNASTSYLQNIISNIDARFDSNSMSKLEDLNNILNPGKYPVTTSGIASHAEAELERVSEWLGPLEGHDGLVDVKRMKDDFVQFKMTVKNLKGHSLASVCTSVITDYNDIFPDYSVLCKYMLTAPLTSVKCERGFSTQNRLKVKARSSLSHQKVSKLIRIMEEGNNVGAIDMSAIVKRFNNMTKTARRK